MPTLQSAGDRRWVRRLFAAIVDEVERARAGGASKAGDRRPLTVVVGRVDELGPEQLAAIAPGDVLHIGAWRSLLYLGPWWARGSPGCGRCLLARLVDSPFGPARAERGAAQVVDHEPIWSPGVIPVAARLAAHEIARHRDPTRPAANLDVLVLDTGTGTVMREHLVPDSTCEVCGPGPRTTLPDLDAASSVGSARGLRGLDLDELGPRLDRAYVHSHVGLLKEVHADLQNPYGASTVEVRVPWGRRESTLGRADTYARSRAIAVIEALERYCGLRRGGMELVRASFDEVAARAVDPRALGLHPDECHRLPGYPFAQFSPDVEIAWVQGHAVRAGRPVLVPAFVGFYGFDPGADPAFVGESSNGCAVGGSAAEAAVHGLLELVERDSFLMAWYRRLLLPELALTGLDDRTRALLAKATMATRCTFRAFLSTMEYGVPSLVLLAISRDADGPCVMAASGAHPDLAAALRSALHELTGLVLRLRHSFERRRDAARALLDDPDLVQTIEDHPLVNALPEARTRFAFLLEQRSAPIPLPEVRRSLDPELTAAGHLARLVGQLADVGLEAIVVDQTCAELTGAGLRCVKVIVPGLLPMTFGHRFRRVDLPRLILGAAPYASGIAPGHRLGSIPHPFP